MKEKLKKFLEKFPLAYKAAFNAYQWLRVVFHIRTRTVLLAHEPTSEKCLQEMEREERFCDIIQDLLLYTGLTKNELYERLRGKPQYHYRSEFLWQDPKDISSLGWFYRSNQGYLFHNATHHYWPKLDFLNKDSGLILEYGAGVGHNLIPLALRGCQVHYFDIGIIQQDFVRFRAKRRNLTNIHFISQFIDNKFDPYTCIREKYDVIILQDVLEHIPDYHVLLAHLIEHLNPGGMIIEQSPFEEDLAAKEIDIHLKAKVPLEKAMTGMVKIERNIWKKETYARS